MILLDEFLQLDMTPEFMEMFYVVIQLGAILERDSKRLPILCNNPGERDTTAFPQKKLFCKRSIWIWS